MMLKGEMTKNKIALMFLSVFILLTVTVIIIDNRNLDIQADEARDCKTCGPQMDSQMPLLVEFLNLLTATEIPVTGLCSSCKASFDGSSMRRIGNYCLIWKGDGSKVVNTFELLVPRLSFTCKCNPLLTGELITPEHLLDTFPCLHQHAKTVTSMNVVNDLSLEALEICESMATSMMNTTLRQPKAQLTVSIINFRIRIEARLDRELKVANILSRVSNMSPNNIKVDCNIHPAYSKVCDCVKMDAIRRLIYYFIETTLPCMIEDMVQVEQFKVLKEYAFCFPDKQIFLYKNQIGNF